MPFMARRGARVRSVAGGMALAVGVLTALPALSADAASCQVWNVTSGGAVGGDLQEAIDAAGAGDVLEVQGVCVGGFVIDMSLTLRRRSTEYPAVLDANRSAPVITAWGLRRSPSTLTLAGLTLRDGRPGVHSVEYVDLWIRNTTIRDSLHASGVQASRGSTHLIDSVVRNNHSDASGGGISTNSPLWVVNSIIVGNTAFYGGGISTSRDLRISGSSFIGGNRAWGGGGIHNEGGTTVLVDHAQVTGNESYGRLGGGGIAVGNHYLPTRLVLRDRASIRQNITSGTHGKGAGIRCEFDCQVRLFGHAAIARNISASSGGGIFGDPYNGNGRNYGGFIRMSGYARISNNRAWQGAGVFLGPGNTLRMEEGARIFGNTATERGGGVYALSTEVFRARIIAGSKAAIAHNLPDNIFRVVD